MNSTVSGEVQDYVLEVRAALADLPVEDVEEFTTGMEADLAERLAEPGEGTLRDRLGDPDAYAAELRSAAGLPPRVAGVEAKKPAAERLSAWWTGVSGQVLSEAPWLRDLRPLWWALRGFILAVVPSQMFGVSIVSLGLLGAAVSVALGLMARHGTLAGEWVGPVRVIGNLTALVLLPIAFVAFLDRGSYSEESYAEPQYSSAPGIWNNGEPVMNIYAYDESGHRLDRVRLFDQQNKPLTIDPSMLMEGLTGEEHSSAFDPKTGGPTFDRTVFPVRWGSGTGWEGIPTEGRWDPPVAITPLPGPVPSVEASPTPSATPQATQTSPGTGATATPTPTPSTTASR